MSGISPLRRRHAPRRRDRASQTAHRPATTGAGGTSRISSHLPSTAREARPPPRARGARRQRAPLTALVRKGHSAPTAFACRRRKPGRSRSPRSALVDWSGAEVTDSTASVATLLLFRASSLDALGPAHGSRFHDLPRRHPDTTAPPSDELTRPDRRTRRPAATPRRPDDRPATGRTTCPTPTAASSSAVGTEPRPPTSTRPLLAVDPPAFPPVAVVSTSARPSGAGACRSARRASGPSVRGAWA